MQTELLETFLDLCETRSFNRTADRLGVTQSTISGRVRALETALGCRLFHRSRAGTGLTTEGLRFEPHARALRQGWTEALQDTAGSGSRAMTLRIGLQRDLTDHHIGDWMRQFRAALPEAAFYIEADYSAQMCADLVSGALDLALLFTPKPQPDLHFETVGELSYRMISTCPVTLSGLPGERYVRANISPAFSAAHAGLLPQLTAAPVSSGQNATVTGLILALDGAGYVLEDTAQALITSGQAHAVTCAPRIPQPVFAALPLRQRHRPLQRRLVTLLRAHFAGRAAQK
ncbi:MAG: LysR family transcriptional regulator [Paracoccaceae bacterium]|nr:LysR family transcriptional regulator [Paracoccaceae bacterium]